MPKERATVKIRIPRGQFRENRGGSYSPEWLKSPRDDVPQTGKPLLGGNTVVKAIIANGNPGEEHAEQPAPQQVSAKCER